MSGIDTLKCPKCGKVVNELFSHVCLLNRREAKSLQKENQAQQESAQQNFLLRIWHRLIGTK